MTFRNHAARAPGTAKQLPLSCKKYFPATPKNRAPPGSKEVLSGIPVPEVPSSHCPLL